MQPHVVLQGRESARKAWTAMAAEGRVPTDLVDTLDPVVARSWQRCVLHMDPRGHPREVSLSPEAFAAVRARYADLILSARAVMEDVHQFTEGTGCAIFLADSTGCVLEVLGDTETCRTLREVGLVPGVYWSEAHMGTNAIALALVEATPVLVVGEEHFFRVLHAVATAAAPIHDIGGRLVGVLGMATPVQRASPHLLAAVMSAARAVTSQLQTDVYVREVNRQLSELQAVFHAISDGVISWNRDGLITHMNQHAAQMLALNAASVLGRPLESVIELPAMLRRAAHQGQAVRDVEATVRANGRQVECLVSFEPIWEGRGQPVGYIMTLRPVERVHHLVHRFVGTQTEVPLAHILGRSRLMQRVRREVLAAARGTAPVLIRGENGVGKNLLARVIHRESPRAQGPFLAINCQAIPREFMLAEFLGYEGGAFTGARKEGRPSKFELANNGTLFLDQVEALSMEVQAALLQVLDAQAVMRLGGTRLIPVNVRVIAATAVDLEQRVQEGHFDAELYYRLAAFTLDIPPLRDHLEDLPFYVQHILERLARVMGYSLRVSDEVWAAFRRYPWPGNIRELESVLEQAVLRAEDGVIRLEHLPRSLRQARVGYIDGHVYQPAMSLAEAEREAILRAARACNGQVTRMAEVLGISRTTLWRRLKALHIDLEPFRKQAG